MLTIPVRLYAIVIALHTSNMTFASTVDPHCSVQQTLGSNQCGESPTENSSLQSGQLHYQFNKTHLKHWNIIFFIKYCLDFHLLPSKRLFAVLQVQTTFMTTWAQWITEMKVESETFMNAYYHLEIFKYHLFTLPWLVCFRACGRCDIFRGHA